MAKIAKKKHMPLIAVRGLVVFPYMNLSFDVARPKSIAAVEQAEEGDRLIFLVSQRDEITEEVSENDLYTVGTVAKIRQKIDMGDAGIRIHIEGICRARMEGFINEEAFLSATAVTEPSLDDLTPIMYEAGVRRLKILVDGFRLMSEHENSNVPPEAFFNLVFQMEPDAMLDSLAGSVLIRIEDKQEILELTSLSERMQRLIELISTELKILETEAVILGKVNEQMEQNNRDYFLREQVRAIREELGESDESDADDYMQKVKDAHLPDYVEEAAMAEIRRMDKSSPSSPENSVSRSYLDLLLELPWNTVTEEETDLEKARQILERDHYGLEKVKERIIEQLAVLKLTGRVQGTILCLVGPPGVGKTSIAHSIAEATGRKFARMSLGGVRDEAEIRGHRRTYVSAMPGRLVNAIKQAGSMNPLILLDEIDKISNDGRGDPASALLEALDGEQNSTFRDNYLEIPMDLSKVLFVTTANSLDPVPRPLLDRMEIIELSSYTREEKHKIAVQHLIPKQTALHGLKKSSFRIKDDALDLIISGYTCEAGVRGLERELKALCRKAAAEIVKGKKSVSITKNSLTKYLGVQKFTDMTKRDIPVVGVATGLAWTSVGGDTLEIEVNVMDGTGKLELTGSLGDVMKESARAALSFVRSIAGELKLNGDFYKTKDIHVHVPEGATPKDGPSAGITIATAIASALSGAPVRNDIAMTGEVTLRGRVLAIGGLKEKSLAAYRLGIRTIIIPEANKKDLEELAPVVRQNVEFIPVKDCRQVLKTALVPVTKLESPPPMISERRPAIHEYS